MYGLKDNNNGYSMFYCDTASDIQDLPKASIPNVKGETCAPFSEALVISTGEVYILRGDTDEWVIPGQS